MRNAVSGSIRTITVGQAWECAALKVLVSIAVALAALPLPLLAQEHEEGGGGHGAPIELLWIPVILLAAKLTGALAERMRQPAVVGELAAGIVLGNLALVGINWLTPVPDNGVVRFLAELGVILLLFQIGLESSIARMRTVGARALGVALIGVVLPFGAGALAVPLIIPGHPTNTYLFIGAALTATSVGITARVFQDLGVLRSREAQIVLGAAVIDDVLGLLILAVVSALVVAGTVGVGTIAWIVAKTTLFLVGAVVIGQLLAPRLGSLLGRLQRGTGMKLTLALVFALVFAYAAGVIGLAPIVGAFAAGLVLMPVHFSHFDEPVIVRQLRALLRNADPELRERGERVVHAHAEKHVEHLIEPLTQVLVPIFFVLTGMMVTLESFLDASTVLVGLALTAIAIGGKLAAGLAAGPVRKWIVGWGMVPRGEVGLIFASIGRALGVIDDRIFSVVVMLVMLTTLATPPILAAMMRRKAVETLPPGAEDRRAEPELV